MTAVGPPFHSHSHSVSRARHATPHLVRCPPLFFAAFVLWRTRRGRLTQAFASSASFGALHRHASVHCNTWTLVWQRGKEAVSYLAVLARTLPRLAPRLALLGLADAHRLRGVLIKMLENEARKGKTRTALQVHVESHGPPAAQLQPAQRVSFIATSSLDVEKTGKFDENLRVRYNFVATHSLFSLSGLAAVGWIITWCYITARRPRPRRAARAVAPPRPRPPPRW